jgi:hypothetical protein
MSETPYVEISWVEHVATDVSVSAIGEPTVNRVVRYDGAVRRVDPAGENGQLVLCEHFPRGWGASTRLHPHRAEHEALECARLVAATKWPTLAVSVAP